MKVLIVSALVALVCCVSAVPIKEVKDCKCGDAYEAQKGSDGNVQCVGKLLDAIRPCNVPEAPRCICKKEKVTGILTDSEGTWCMFGEQGQPHKKWPCENADEWAAYHAEVEKYKETAEH